MLLFEIGLFKHFTFDLHKKDTLIFRYNLETCQTNFPQQRDLLFSYLLLRTSGQNFALRHYKDISRLPNIMYMLCRRGRETTLQIGRGQTIVCIHQSVRKTRRFTVSAEIKTTNKTASIEEFSFNMLLVVEQVRKRLFFSF